MKYDDASWHYGGDFPEGLPDEAGATHIAMFVVWMVLNGCSGELHIKDDLSLQQKLNSRDISPGEWFIRSCDEKFTDEDLDDFGNEFALAYYANETSNYMRDYVSVFGDQYGVYDVPDSWESYDLIAPTIDRRLRKWQRSKLSIWKRLFS